MCIEICSGVGRVARSDTDTAASPPASIMRVRYMTLSREGRVRLIEGPSHLRRLQVGARLPRRVQATRRAFGLQAGVRRVWHAGRPQSVLCIHAAALSVATLS